MKKLALLMVLTVSILFLNAPPAEAFGLRKVLGAPFFVVGFVAALVADVTVVPLYKGATHYIDEPPVKGW